MIRHLDTDVLAKLQEDFASALDKAVEKKKQTRVVSFNEAGREAVAASLEDLCDLGASLYAPFDIERLHEMRIAAKRLRYAVELFTACWGEKIAPFAEEIAEMQTFLGEVHDCDVWLEDLGERLRPNRSRNGSANGSERQANARLMSEFVKTRTKNYRTALRLWSDWEANDFTGRIRTIIRAA